MCLESTKTMPYIGKDSAKASIHRQCGIECPNTIITNPNPSRNRKTMSLVERKLENKVKHYKTKRSVNASWQCMC